MKLLLKVLIVFFIIILSGCKTGNKQSGSSEPVVPSPNDEYFQEISESIGLRFRHSIGDDELTNIIESSCGGAAFLDYDRDGYIDIYVTSGTWVEKLSHGERPAEMPTNKLFRNRGDGTFEDVTKRANAAGEWYTMGVSVGDYDNDGYPDLFLSCYGPNVLLHNEGNGTFKDVTKKAGVAGKHECSVGSVWVDYNNDGLLDLYVGNYLTFDPEYKYYYAPDGFPGPMAYEAEKDYLYRNNGDGTFTDVTEEAGIIDADGRAMGVGAFDYDDDGFIDIYVANDHTMNYLWHNEGGKTFTDKGIYSGTAFSQAGEATVSMSVDFSDFNNDGLIDMFLSDDTYSSLYKNIGGGVFIDQANASGIAMQTAQFVSWSSCFFDYDNDGDQDIFMTNGALKHLYGQEDQLFENDGSGNFKDISGKLGSYFFEEHVGRGACLGDYDNDGDIDIFIVNLNDRGIFLRNNKGNSGNWIILNFTGTKSNRDAVGVKVKIEYGGKYQIAQKRSTAGYLSQNDPRLHFGLGNSEMIDKIEIRWPSGTFQVLENIKANQIVNIVEP